jgi:4-amino-4-deoxy-L-arabinose transferase-like glycosyltransferase
MKLSNKVNKFLTHINDRVIILFIAVFAFIIRIPAFFIDYSIWWDSTAYIAVGKHIFSLGKIGFYNATRPPVVPVLIGFADKIGIDAIIMGKFISVFAACLAAVAMYLIFRELGFRTAGIFAGIIMGFEPVIYTNSYQILTSVPAMMFGLFAVYFALKVLRTKKYFHFYLCGLLVALSMLTRLYFILVGGGIALFFIYWNFIKIRDFAGIIRKFIINTSVMGAGFFTLTIPYMIINYVVYKNPLHPFIISHEEIHIVKLGRIYELSNFQYYFQQYGALSWILMILAVTAICIIFFNALKKKEKAAILVFIFAITYSYVILGIPTQEARFSILFLPFMLALAVFGINYILRLIKPLNIKTTWADITVLLFLVLLAAFSFFPQITHFVKVLPQSSSDKYDFLSEKYFNENRPYIVISSTPYLSTYVDAKLLLMYFPTYKQIIDYESIHEIDYVLISLNTNPCESSHEFCQKYYAQQDEAFKYLNETYNLLEELIIDGAPFFLYGKK